jgi:hypothetical protein
MNTKIKHYNKWLKHSLFRIQLNITVCTLENKNWSIYSSGRNLLCLETDFNNVSCYSSSAYPIRKLVGCPRINKGHSYRRSVLLGNVPSFPIKYQSCIQKRILYFCNFTTFHHQFLSSSNWQRFSDFLAFDDLFVTAKSVQLKNWKISLSILFCSFSNCSQRLFFL